MDVLREYCLNSTISGLSYIVDARYHYSERIFWLLCLLFSTMGSYHFIMDTLTTFESDSISMVMETLQPGDTTSFPSLAVCEMGSIKEEYPFLETFTDKCVRVFVQEMVGISLQFHVSLFRCSLTASSEDEDNNGDVYDFLMRIVYFNLYTSNTFQAYCKKYENQENVVACPQDGYLEFSKKSSILCGDFMTDCTWMGRPFDCCQYFRPLRSTYGPCFFLNNIQAVTK